MDWFEKLNDYFPVHEMKSKEHMEMLLKERGDVYYKDEGEHHVVMYAEFPEFIFIDYLYVAGTARGQGLGHQLIEKLKKHNKPIILEVEPVDYNDTDTEKRLHFYKREGFTHATSIGYNRRSLATNEDSPLEILYWSPTDQGEESIYEQMRHMYEHIHTYKDEVIYGKRYQTADEVLKYGDDLNKDNILDELKK
ncbi:acetyltransferase (GNAT) family protein [Streptohalobacillus salinus]|uniref:Acetyltransferase (GNAT) family protein n=1 Tax=Streptohalobacillus salinus TaxID=621096 RepID=A0A2V3WHS5_9BACI|nr:GNAT family N-acetyltransferase [Streptohalobacillus salinus]PXW93127.1 acetyltransferase (GNAT) family protein [Streptohalobacillus salinus]